MTNMVDLILSFSISFLAVFFAIPKIILVSNVKKLFAVPNHRTANQEKIIPNLGGIAIFSGIFIGTIVSLNNLDVDKITGSLLAALIMFLIGLQDDTIGLSARKKLIGQILVSFYLIIVCNIRFTNLHGLLGINEINSSVGMVLSLITIIGITNAFNLIDGIDGLAAGIGTLISATYGFLFLYFGQLEFAFLCFSITGGLIAFFFYNVFGKENKIFMGDTGSLMLGALFAILTICFNEMIPANHTNNQAWTFPAISLAIMIVPVIDSIRIIYVRISQGHSPFTADMNHIHHQMIKITSKNHLHATIIMVLFNLGFICLSLGFIDQLGNNILFVGLLVAGFAVAGIPFFINKSKEKDSRTSKSPDIIGSDTNQESGIPEKRKNGTTKTTRENYANMDKIQSN